MCVCADCGAVRGERLYGLLTQWTARSMTGIRGGFHGRVLSDIVLLVSLTPWV